MLGLQSRRQCEENPLHQTLGGIHRPEISQVCPSLTVRNFCLGRHVPSEKEKDLFQLRVFGFREFYSPGYSDRNGSGIFRPSALYLESEEGGLKISLAGPEEDWVRLSHRD